MRHDIFSQPGRWPGMRFQTRLGWNVARLATLRDDDDDGEMIELLMINVHDSVNEGACGRTHRTLSPLRRLDGLLRAALVAAI